MSNDADRLVLIEQRLAQGDQRMNGMQEELTKNTQITTEVREILEVAKSGLNVLGGIGKVLGIGGKLAAAGVAIWGAIYALMHHGQLPPGGKP